MHAGLVVWAASPARAEGDVIATRQVEKGTPKAMDPSSRTTKSGLACPPGGDAPLVQRT